MYHRQKLLVLVIAYCFQLTFQQACTNGAVRLQGGPVDGPPFLGRVEVCIEEEWGTVCRNQWGNQDAAVVCRQLGFVEYGTALPFAGGSGAIHLDQVECSGTELFLLNCSHSGVGNNTCTHSLDAGVICYENNGCKDGEVNLTSGRNDREGRVEVCFGGTWGTICDDLWDNRDAEVVCNQLGFTEGAYGIVGLQDPSAPEPVFLDMVNCTGEESNLTECIHLGIHVHQCAPHFEDAGVVCQAPNCTDGEITVIGSAYKKEGRVEICFNNTWYAVCGDNWGQSEASVVCRQLGYIPKHSLTAGHFGQGSRAHFMGHFNCSGSEADLTGCLVHNEHLCQTTAAVQCEAPCLGNGITTCSQCSGSSCTVATENSCTCSPKCLTEGRCCRDILNVEDCFEPPVECNDTEVRLAGGSSETNGRVELCLGGHWGTICDYQSGWDSENAAVVCQQLGLPATGAYALPSEFFVGEGPVFLEEVDCREEDPSLLECHNHGVLGFHQCGVDFVLGRGGLHDHDASISCGAECTDGTVRLVEGTSDENGRVEVCRYGIWGTVCDDLWDDQDAAVVCRELGFSSIGVSHITYSFGAGAGPIFVHSVNCTGNESRLSDCPHLNDVSGVCQHIQDAGVVCGVGQPDRCSNEGANLTYQEDLDRFGSCELYGGASETCNDFTLAENYVFVVTTYGPTQSDISTKLDSISDILLVSSDQKCRDAVSLLLCNVYFSPCGTEDARTAPISLCPEECEYVVENCSDLWIPIMSDLKEKGLPVIDCSNPAVILPPIETCCSGFGIGMSQSMPPQSPSSGSNDNETLIIGIAVPVVVLLLLLLVIVCIVIMLYFRRMRIRVKKLKRSTLQLDRQTSECIILDTRQGTVWRKLSESELLSPAGGDQQTPQSGRPSIRYTGSIFGSHVHDETGQVAQLMPPRPPSPTTSSYLRKLPPHMLIPSTQIRLLDCIGQGEFGIVYKAHMLKHPQMAMRTNVDPKTVAVKTLKGCFDRSAIHDMLEESVKMKSFSHQNVLSLLGVCVDAGPTPYIVMPYMSNGSLQLYLRKEREDLLFPEEPGVDAEEDKVLESQKRLLNMCSQVCKGMEYLAEKKFVHRDLAARNCMIDSHYVIKVSDFGLSEDLYAKNYFRQDAETSVKLPVKWMAPESLTDGVFTEKTDVWSYGITCWEVFSAGKTPYPGVNPMSLIRLLETGVRMEKPFNAACSDTMYEVMNKCWHKSPDKRPTFSELAAEITGLLTNLAGYLTLETINGIVRESPPVEVENEKDGESGSMSSLDESNLKKRDLVTPVGIAIHLERSNSILEEESLKCKSVQKGMMTTTISEETEP